jgi:hypothetical protein
MGGDRRRTVRDSTDGRWRWDGQQWVVAGESSARRRVRWPWLLAAALVVLVTVAGVLLALTQQPDDLDTSASGANSAACAPQPCANDRDGWIVTVSDVRYGAASGNRFEVPDDGTVYVTLSVTFTNRLAGQSRAIPASFTLLDGAGVRHAAISISSCQLWDPADLPAGGTLGPRCLAFEATAGRPGGLDLIWTPTPGGDGHDIHLS